MQLIVTAAILVSYLCAREVVYRVFPDHDFSTWVTQDTIMDVPRLVASAASLWFGLRWYGAQRLGLVWRKSTLPILVCACHCVAAYAFGRFRPSFGATYDQLAILAFSSFLVAVNEELLFRGLIFQELLSRFGSRTAVWVTTCAFVAYHYNSQPIWALPQVLLIGGAYTILRALGYSLFGLIAAHTILDSLVFVMQGKGDPSYGWDYVTWLGLLAIPFVALLWLTRGGAIDPSRHECGAKQPLG